LATDPVAIDCVMYDFLDWQSARTAQHETCLVQAAAADQGTRDHWDNPTAQNYSALEFVQLDMQNPMPFTGRADVERKIKDFKQGAASEEEVRETIRSYIETN
jgi:hypothetical protein